MGNTKSYRFSEQTETYLKKLTEIVECNERELIEASIEKMFHDWKFMSKDIVIDFHDNLFGINNDRVQIFIQSLPNAGYEISYYGNGDRLIIHEIE